MYTKIKTMLKNFIYIDNHCTEYKSYPKVYFSQGLDDGVDMKVVTIGDVAYVAGYDDSLDYMKTRYHELCSIDLAHAAVKELGIEPKFIEILNPKHGRVAIEMQL